MPHVRDCHLAGAALIAALLGSAPAHAAALAAGWGHNLYVSGTRQAWAWGGNEYGKLGNATAFGSSVPVRAGTLSDVIAVAAGERQSVALRLDGTVWAWGGSPSNAPGPETCTLYDPFTNQAITVPCAKTPRQVSGISGATAVASGTASNLVLIADGTVRQFANFSAPTTVAGLSGVAAIGAGDEFFAALKSDGTVWTWGNGFNGELGAGTAGPQLCNARDTYSGEFANRPCSGAPVRVTGLTGVVAISVGGRHALALRSDGTVWTWGSNHYGQMGDGTTAHRFTAYQVPGLTNVAQIAAGFNHSLALRFDGALWGWGQNNHGQLGIAASQSCLNPGQPAVPCNRSPSRVNAHDGARTIAAGGAHTLTVRPDGSLVAFGLNNSGQLGYGVPATLPPALPGGIDPHKYFVGSFAPTIASGASLGTTSNAGGLDLDTIDHGLVFGAQPVGTTSPSREVRFQNLQSIAIAIQSLVASGDFARTHNCPATVPANSGCSIFVTFTPAAAGERAGALTMTTNAPDAPTLSLALHGTGGSAPSAPVQNYSDIWWNPNESGWGITIADHETNIFAVWYTYEASGKPVWFTIPGGTLSADRRVLTGDVWSTTGPCYSAATFNPAQVTAVRRGTATLDFAPAGLEAGSARFSGSIGSTSWSKVIRRMDIYGNAPPAWGSDYTDIWWNSTQSGWGLTLAQHGTNIFGVLYTYDCDGSPLFLTMPGVTFSGATLFAGDLYSTQSSGSWYGSATFNPAHITATKVGSATFSVAGQVASFTPVINGSTRPAQIWPQPFGNRAPGTP